MIPLITPRSNKLYFAVLITLAMMSLALSFRTGILRGGVKISSSRPMRTFAGTPTQHQHNQEVSDLIVSKTAFEKAYPNYAIDTKTEFVAPSVVSSEALEKLYEGLTPKLSMLYRLCSGSKIEFVVEVIRNLSQLANMWYIYWRKELLDENGAELDFELNESTKILMPPTRWVYNSKTQDGIVKQVVHYRYGISVTDQPEFWQACAEGVVAYEKNILTSAKKPEKNAEEISQELGISPVYVALTDWISWRFMKIENRVITLSSTITPFPVSSDGTIELKFNSDLATLLQYLCGAMNIPAQTAEDVKRLTADYETRARLKWNHAL